LIVYRSLRVCSELADAVIPEAREASHETGFFRRFHELAELTIWNPVTYKTIPAIH